MATTGFWPVKGSLKDVVKYAENPDKTTNPKYLDDDLAAALKYVSNDDKTDMQLFVGRGRGYVTAENNKDFSSEVDLVFFGKLAFLSNENSNKVFFWLTRRFNFD